VVRGSTVCANYRVTFLSLIFHQQLKASLFRNFYHIFQFIHAF